MKSFCVNLQSNLLFTFEVEAVDQLDAVNVAKEFMAAELKRFQPINPNSKVIWVDFQKKQIRYEFVKKHTYGSCKLLEFPKQAARRQT
jgi:hypothetical protein